MRNFKIVKSILLVFCILILSFKSHGVSLNKFPIYPISSLDSASIRFVSDALPNWDYLLCDKNRENIRSGGSTVFVFFNDSLFVSYPSDYKDAISKGKMDEYYTALGSYRFVSEDVIELDYDDGTTSPTIYLKI